MLRLEPRGHLPNSVSGLSLSRFDHHEADVARIENSLKAGEKKRFLVLFPDSSWGTKGHTSSALLYDETSWSGG
jgi:hypothetical protein